ncbi:hypothetical protein CVT24_000892 [Panaeolus cyanescens]|uniref:Dynamin-type G domain-containing protein n=1 Tax=Panaeolus cyanescens TaxID=181874 RepID=A0A409YTF0_9AGAR|nr:hypothetical protein CVT24_000892 [Panaeolus cyanescens]
MFGFSAKKKGKQRATDDSTSENYTPPLPDPDNTNQTNIPDDMNIPDDLNTQDDLPPPVPDGTGDDDVHNSSYAARCREVMHLYSDLKLLLSGLNLNIQLPRVVVIGGQSSGKSSLVEAVSKINVPRDSGTCTRCPMICEISSDATEWSCTVSLDIAGTSVPNGAGGSVKGHRRILFDRTTDKTQVEIILRRAQAAILNYPDRDVEDFLTKSKDELTLMSRQHDFSENKIVVQLKDPKATDVHFVDLPGLIQNADSSLIKLIQHLTKKEISQKNTIIVIAMPMTDDYQLMQAVKLAQKADPTGLRTLGVLTKPDSLSSGATGSRNEWRSIIEGYKHKTQHGYFCVRLPDDEDRNSGKTHAEMETIAKDFFESQSPWSDMQAEFGWRFGVKNLVKYISPLLMKMIETNIPLLLKEVQDELTKSRAALAALPVLSTQDPAVEIIMRITAFCDEIEKEVFGSQTHKLAQQSRRVYNDFKESIQDTQPRFDPSPCRLSLSIPPASNHNPVLTIADVQKEIEETTGWELPGHVPFEATENIVLRHIKPWNDITFNCFEQIYTIVDDFLDPLKKKHFKPYFYLLAHIEKHVRAHLSHSKLNCETMLNKLLALEQKPIYTWNTDILQEQVNLWFTSLYDQNGYQYSRTTHNENLDMMAKLYAYCKVASRRFIDYAPLMMEHELKQFFMSTLKSKLLASIFSPSPPSAVSLETRLSNLLCEDPITANRRSELIAKITTLSQIRGRISAFNIRQLGAGPNVLDKLDFGSVVVDDDDAHSIALSAQSDHPDPDPAPRSQHQQSSIDLPDIGWGSPIPEQVPKPFEEIESSAFGTWGFNPPSPVATAGKKKKKKTSVFV